LEKSLDDDIKGGAFVACTAVVTCAMFSDANSIGSAWWIGVGRKLSREEW